MSLPGRAEFEAQLSRTFTATLDGGDSVDLKLTGVFDGSIAAEGCESFSIELEGPGDPILSQGMYELSYDAGTLELFLVPVEKNARGLYVYEAVFNRKK